MKEYNFSDRRLPRDKTLPRDETFVRELSLAPADLPTPEDSPEARANRHIQHSLQRLRQLAAKVAEKPHGHSRRFFWHYFRAEVERIRKQRAALCRARYGN